MKQLTYFCYYTLIIAGLISLFNIIKATFEFNWIHLLFSLALFCIIFIDIACEEMYDEPRGQMIKFIDKYLK